uniref:Uncharacterized protein n=1 Tax=Trypanosoma vivax (strain Y486) TaxID=1055687 RepID=G0TXS2_TRYVY|nr:conserved hypothetical protein [Trypanosoma vivax Y486]
MRVCVCVCVCHQLKYKIVEFFNVLFFINNIFAPCRIPVPITTVQIGVGRVPADKVEYDGGRSRLTRLARVHNQTIFLVITSIVIFSGPISLSLSHSHFFVFVYSLCACAFGLRCSSLALRHVIFACYQILRSHQERYVIYSQLLLFLSVV